MTHFSDALTRPRIPFGIRPRRADPVVLRLLRELRERIRRLYPMKYTVRLTSSRGSASRSAATLEKRKIGREKVFHLGERYTKYFLFKYCTLARPL